MRATYASIDRITASNSDFKVLLILVSPSMPIP